MLQLDIWVINIGSNNNIEKNSLIKEHDFYFFKRQKI